MASDGCGFETVRRARRQASAVVGITGGIASGKTTATNALAAAGFTVIDADEIARAITAAGTPTERLLAAQFPQAAQGGTLNRKILREIISADGCAREKLNSITHPLIVSEVKRQISEASGDVVLSAPLLFETGLNTLCATVVCVACPYAKQLQRLISRDGVTEQSAAAMIAAQISDAERAARSDYVINSDMPQDKFEHSVITLFADLFDKLRG